MQETQETWLWSLGWQDSPGGEHSNPLQYSCLENPMDRGAWWATVQRVTNSQTQLKQLSTYIWYWILQENRENFFLLILYFVFKLFILANTLLFEKRMTEIKLENMQPQIAMINTTLQKLHWLLTSDQYAVFLIPALPTRLIFLFKSSVIRCIGLCEYLFTLSYIAIIYVEMLHQSVIGYYTKIGSTKFYVYVESLEC